MSEKTIKSKSRVQKHGEVFTPRRIVNKMLDIPEIKEACENLTTTFLEPSAGEGAFLIAILERKLRIVQEEYNDTLAQYENYSLLALTTLYGVELLEDNAQTCVMNMFQTYYDMYKESVEQHEGHLNKSVLNSAKKIISLNIENGNFLTREAVDGTPLVFSEWKPLNLGKRTIQIKVQRTEYTLDEIYENVQKENGQVINHAQTKAEQLSIFDMLDEAEEEDSVQRQVHYVPINIVDVFKEEMKETDG